VYPTKVIIHKIKRQCVRVVLNFLRERIGQPRKSSHLHPHGEILTLGIACRNVFPLRVSDYSGRKRANALRRAVPRFRIPAVRAIELDEHRVVNVIPERQINSFQINLMAVSGQLHSIGETRCQIVHEVLRVPCAPASQAPARNEFRIRAESRPSPHITVTELAAKFLRDVLFLRVAKRPNFIALNPLARQVAKRLVLILSTSCSYASEQFRNCVFCYLCHANSSANRIALDEGRNHCNLPFNREVVHA